MAKVTGTPLLLKKTPPMSHENGKFVWIMDPDQNKVELREPKA